MGVLDTEAVKGEARTCSLFVERVPAHAALNYVCHMTGLSWELRDEAIFLSTPERLRQRQGPSVRFYHLWGIAGTRAETLAFARFIRAVAEGAGLADPKAEPRHIGRPGNVLHAIATPQDQAFVAQLRNSLAVLEPGQRRSLPDPCEALDGLGLPKLPFVDEPPPQVAATLKTPINVHVRDAELGALLAELARGTKATLVLDRDPDLRKARVTLDARMAPFGDVLKSLVEQAHATCLPLEHGFLIATPARARTLRPLPCVLYDARPIASGEEAAKALEEKLSEACRRSGEWAERHVLQRYKTAFFLRTTATVHAQIQKLLAEMKGK
jgi:hypothetical protein